jgi:hypothetical protein
MRRQNEMVFLLGVLLALLASPASAQVTIVKNGVTVPEEKAQILFNMTCRVVAEEFHLPEPTAARFPVTLVLGDSNERVLGDELNQTYFIYMNRWDDVQFTTSASRLALQHLISKERKAKLVVEILQRAERVAPVSARALEAASARR